jgi:RNA polymerase sigma-70 factor (ECF subfamily)
MQDNKLTKALVVNAQYGNNSAFEQLYRMTIESVYALLIRLTGDSSNAEKLSIKMYVNAWQQISEKEENTTVLSWFKKIAVETYLMDFSDSSESTNDDNAAMQTKYGALEKYYNEYPLEKYLQELDHRSRLIFILHDLENLTYDEIKEFLHIPIEEIRRIMINSREKLISLLES